MAFDAPEYFNRYATQELYSGKTRCIYADDFSRTNLSAWDLTKAVRSFEYSYESEASLKLTPGNNNNDEAIAVIYTNLSTIDRAAVSFQFCYFITTQNMELEIELYFTDNNVYKKLALVWASNTKAWYYLDAVGTKQLIPGSTKYIFKSTAGSPTWNYFEFAVDFGHDIGLYLMSNNLLIDLTSYALNEGVDATDRTFLYAAITGRNIGGALGLNYYLGKFLLREC